jgi:hypothetical protein
MTRRREHLLALSRRLTKKGSRESCPVVGLPLPGLTSPHIPRNGPVSRKVPLVLLRRGGFFQRGLEEKLLQAWITFAHVFFPNDNGSLMQCIVSPTKRSLQ